ncbi:MAG: acylneuraminate cytidylyltransferase [Candidatus Aenigmatarchaeota archaeon]|nr:MAG: acylneuraminate cytidylyltransferase [Candidatus Aenigmarchaeota archaeon]
MKVGILIAVRMKSTRLPKKATRVVSGKTIIEHLIERVKNCKRVDEIILCTSTHPDDSILVEIAQKNGIKWFRGDEDDVLKRFIDAAERFGLDIVVRVTGDNPLTDPEYIDKIVEKQMESGAEYVYIEGLPAGTKAEVMTLEALKKARRLAENPEMSEYMTLYFRDSGLFKVEKVVADKEVYRPEYRLTVDTEEDLDVIREIYEKLYKGGYFPLIEVIKFLDSNPGVVRRNINVKKRSIFLRVGEGGRMYIGEKNGEG